jgi:alkyl sulfatase BDS1-like metallo-beta-lactamase superfamily hydrolase
VLNHTAGVQADDADATIKLSRDTLNDIVLQQTTLEKAIADGDVKIDGDADKLGQLVSMLDTFEFWFNIITPPGQS